MAEDLRVELTRLRRRLEREQRIRQAAEAISEQALSELYEKQQNLRGEIRNREAVEAQLRQAQKMEAVGRLAGGVAHDFNNLLTVINCNAELALSVLPAHSPARGDIEEIRRAGERAAGLTRQLLAFSRNQIISPVLLTLDSVVEDLASMLRRLIGEDIQFSVTRGADQRTVLADRGQLEQIIVNLAVNARDAMPRGGMLRIETGPADLDDAFRRAHPEVLPGSFAVLAVSDTGTGMDAHVAAHVFEPFFTTKGPGKGTGLGLSSVYGAVKQSGGYVYLDTELGRGTTFRVYLPEAEGVALDEPHRTADTRPLEGTGETVLIVEDEDGVRVLARRILEASGYQVLEAAAVADALRLCADHEGAIDLALLDVLMPGMSGPEVADCVRDSRPGTRVLYMSGYTDDLIAHHGVLAAGVSLLQKPFTPQSLVLRVREILDSPAPLRDAPSS